MVFEYYSAARKYTPMSRTVTVKWRLLLLLLIKNKCSSFVWNSQGLVFYSHRSESQTVVCWLSLHLLFLLSFFWFEIVTAYAVLNISNQWIGKDPNCRQLRRDKEIVWKVLNAQSKCGKTGRLQKEIATLGEELPPVELLPAKRKEQSPDPTKSDARREELVLRALAVGFMWESLSWWWWLLLWL